MRALISPEAITRYLAQIPRRVPRFKGVNPRQLQAAINGEIGIPYRPKTGVRGKHQLEGIAFALYLRRAMLFYDMRLGKTKMALDWAEHLRRSGLWIGKGLVVVHAPIALDVWEFEAPKHSYLKVRIVRTKPLEFIEALESDCDLVVVPWSGLQQIFAEKRAVKVHKLVNKKSTYQTKNKVRPNFENANIASEAFSLAIIDEIHRAKNKQTIRFKIALALLQYCQFRLGLTGTPFGRDPFDLWAQAYLIDGGKTLGNNYNFFRAAFGKEIEDRMGRKTFVFDDSKRTLLRGKIDTLALSCQRSEVHDVNIMTGEIVLHMSGEQKTAYERAVNHLIKTDEGETQELLAVFVRLRQISSGYLPFLDAEGNERVMTFAYNPKTVWLTDFLQEDPPVQIIIFHEFIKSGEIICATLKELGISHAWLYGATRNTKEIVSQFNTGKIKVLVANVVKGGMAIDLPTADYVVFWESPTSPVVRQQAEARPMSRGEKLLIIDDMLCSNVERRILSFIREGKDLLQSLVHARKSLV